MKISIYVNIIIGIILVPATKGGKKGLRENSKPAATPPTSPAPQYPNAHMKIYTDVIYLLEMDPSWPRGGLLRGSEA